jgi:hypothetical protein
MDHNKHINRKVWDLIPKSLLPLFLKEAKMGMPSKKFTFDIPGYIVTTEDGSEPIVVRGLVYNGLDYGQLQVMQKMFANFADKLIELGNASMTPEQKAAYYTVMEVN